LAEENFFTPKAVSQVQPSDVKGRAKLLKMSEHEEAFHFARHGKVSALARLLKSGFKVDAQDEFGNTVLVIGCQNNNKKIVKLALRFGAKAGHSNKVGHTGLFFCIKFGYKALEKYMRARI